MAVSEEKIQKQVAAFRDMGRLLDETTSLGEADKLRMRLMRELLKIRDKKGERVPFVPNEAQRIIASKWGKKNIVLKARQLGITTYVAARFFIDTITHPGTLTVQVAHDQRSAEDMFRIVHRFQENLPEELREGVLKTSRSNVRQLRWPHLDCEYRVETAADPNAGRGMTIRNLHCSEVAMWSRDGGEALVSLRAAVPPDGQVVLDSTQAAWSGEYQAWSDFLPADIWPGDVLQLNMPSRGCAAGVVAREVRVESVDPANERSQYAIRFANDAAEPVAIEARPVTQAEAEPLTLPNASVFTLAALPQAEVTTITDTQVTIDAGCDPIAEGGFEVRWNHAGWGPQTDTNLAGRYNTRVMTVPRLGRSASYWVRQYDGAGHY